MHALEKMAFAAGSGRVASGRDWSRLSAPREREETTSLGRWVSDLSRAVASRKSVDMRYQAQASGEVTPAPGRSPPLAAACSTGSARGSSSAIAHLRGDLRTLPRRPHRRGSR